ncbi:hypothetical protein INT48_007846 [Thamnidium elegans]|uniref:Carboxypeptidase n=1 Tax=Thamnidium elegans TaxID=101142 RepID=A0A8H7W0H9_9FUNG|nr:hypothetical protein INT48_007846 [Thamnidium elegans]
MIFLDQPVNSGYSYHNTSTSIADSNAAANEVYIFLQLFFREFPQFAGSDFHIAGESYAGHFLPAIASKIHNSNQKNKSSIQLKSVLIGNGLIDPQTQYRYYKAMACENPTYPNLLTSSKACHELESNQDECQKEIKNCYQQTDFTLPTRDSAYACMVATSVCNLNVVKPVIENTDRNIYDIRKKCEDGPMCYDYFTAIKKYLDRSDVKHELGVSPSIQFELCSDTVNGHFQNTGDWMRPYVHQLTQLLDQGIRVLAYAGDSDLMCNWMGIRAWTLNLQWQGQPDYHNQDDVDYYTLNGTHAGTIRKNSGLAFIRLYNAGHMAPFDQPENTLDMFNRWISATL